MRLYKGMAGALALVATAVVLAASAPTQRPQDATAHSDPDAFSIDPGHSTLIFKIRLHKVANFYGRVNAPQGSFLLTDDPDESFIEVNIATKNIDGGLKARDQYLAGVDFFNAREYPDASFKSDKIRRIDATTFEAEGEFTMKGVTIPLTVPLTQYAEADMGRLGYRAGFEAVFTIKRSDFGMTAHLDDGQLGDEVQVTVAIDGGRAN
jgi:polyisoprenoid-binding protein YceI